MRHRFALLAFLILVLGIVVSMLEPADLAWLLGLMNSATSVSTQTPAPVAVDKPGSRAGSKMQAALVPGKIQ